MLHPSELIESILSERKETNFELKAILERIELSQNINIENVAQKLLDLSHKNEENELEIKELLETIEYE